MSGFWILAALVGGAVLGGGCGKEAESVAPLLPDQPLAAPGEPMQAQPKLSTMKLFIGAQELNAELALTPEQIRTGMMFRTNLETNAAMLFVLPYTQQAAFWMKNCPSPLSVAYIDEEGVIVEIHDLQPYDTNSVVAASATIRFALETPQGWFQKHQIHEGMAVATERGPLRQTFLGKR